MMGLSKVLITSSINIGALVFWSHPSPVAFIFQSYFDIQPFSGA